LLFKFLLVAYLASASTDLVDGQNGLNQQPFAVYDTRLGSIFVPHCSGQGARRLFAWCRYDWLQTAINTETSAELHFVEVQVDPSRDYFDMLRAQLRPVILYYIMSNM
jgi:hypothetical protein